MDVITDYMTSDHAPKEIKGLYPTFVFIRKTCLECQSLPLARFELQPQSVHCGGSLQEGLRNLGNRSSGPQGHGHRAHGHGHVGLCQDHAPPLPGRVSSWEFSWEFSWVFSWEFSWEFSWVFSWDFSWVFPGTFPGIYPGLFPGLFLGIFS